MSFGVAWRRHLNALLDAEADRPRKQGPTGLGDFLLFSKNSDQFGQARVENVGFDTEGQHGLKFH